MPTAFVATYGEGKPVISVLGEFDALPGLAQSKSPFKDVIDNGTGAGHRQAGFSRFGLGRGGCDLCLWLRAGHDPPGSTDRPARQRPPLGSGQGLRLRRTHWTDLPEKPDRHTRSRRNIPASGWRRPPAQQPQPPDLVDPGDHRQSLHPVPPGTR